MKLWCHVTWSALVQVMACVLCDTKPLPELTLTYCQLHPRNKFFVKFQPKYTKFLSRGGLTLPSRSDLKFYHTRFVHQSQYATTRGNTKTIFDFQRRVCFCQSFITHLKGVVAFTCILLGHSPPFVWGGAFPSSVFISPVSEGSGDVMVFSSKPHAARHPPPAMVLTR